MGSKSKRRHAQKQYNRAQNKPPVASVAPETDGTAAADSALASAAPILTAKELRQLEKERQKQAKATQKLQIQQDKASKTKKEGKKQFFLIRFFKWLGRGFAEIGSELKKVHWPTFKQIMKATGIVLGIVVGFGIVLFGIWELLGWLYNLLITM